MDTFRRVYQKIQNMLKHCIAFALISSMCVILLGIFCRFVIFHSLTWSEELSRYLFVFMVLIGVNIGITDDLMVKIDIIDGALSPKAKKIVSYLRLFFGIAVNGFFFYGTFDMIRIGRFQVSPALRIPMCYLYIILCVGFFLAIISTIIKIIEMHRSKIKEE